MTKKRRAASLPNLDVSLLLDRTGSMAGDWTETVMAVNAFVQKILNDEAIDARVKVTVFDRNGPEIDLLCIRPWSVEGGWKDIQPDETPPRGNTPLYEAIGRTLADLKTDVRPGRNQETRIQFVVMTDGEENASSSEWTHDRCKALVKECDARPHWSVIFLGANIDAVKVGMSLGTQYGSTMSYEKRNTVSTLSSLASNSTRFAASGSSVAWTAQQRATAADVKRGTRVKK